MDVKTTKSQRVRYRLIHLPHYLVWKLGDLLAGIDQNPCG